jgi:hypothetical protein
VKDDLPEAEGHFGDWFAAQIKTDLSAKTSARIQVSVKEGSYFKERRDTLNNKTITYPTAEFSDGEDVVLLINPIKVYRYMETTVHSNTGAPTMAANAQSRF